MPGADISPWELLPFTSQLFKGKARIFYVSFSLLLLFILMLFQNFPSILLAELLCFVCCSAVVTSGELTLQDGRGKKTATPRGGGGGTPMHYLYGYVPPKGVVILKLLI